MHWPHCLQTNERLLLVMEFYRQLCRGLVDQIQPATDGHLAVFPNRGEVPRLVDTTLAGAVDNHGLATSMDKAAIF